MKISELDPETGRFPSNVEANIITNETVDLDSMKSLILVPDDDFVEGQIKNIGYFDEVINIDQLETIIIKNGLTEKVPSLQDKIGINKAYNAYKPFLWLRFDTRKEGNKSYAQFILTKPDTLEDLFVVEKYLDYVWNGVNDQNTWYPMFNAIVDYIDEQSTTWQPNQ
jgi:hypothetical protein